MGLYTLDRLKFMLKDRYFDRTFNGLDLDAVFETARGKMRNISNTGEIFIVANETLSLLNDSHTGIFPPPRKLQNDFGFGAMMFGGQCLVTHVRPGGPAFEKGLRAGDEIVSFGSVVPTKKNFDTIVTLIYWLAPVEVLELSIVGLDGIKRQIVIPANMRSIRERKDAFDKEKDGDVLKPFVCKDVAADFVICKLRTFDVEIEKLRGLYRSIEGKKKLVLDLRGNGGGYVVTLNDFLERLFDNRVLLGTEKSRTGSKEVFLKGRKDSFKGDLSILIDSATASAAEIVARVVQLEKRGKIFGDISAGAVRTSRSSLLPVPLTPGGVNSSAILSFVSVTVADILMSDGRPIEGIGVIPDVGLVPNNIAVSRNFDPVLSHVLETMGVSMSPEEAGKMGFIENRSLEFSIIRVPRLPEYWAN